VLQHGLENEIIRCPWHGWEFHIPSGDAVFGISTRRLRKYKTDVRDDDIYVAVPIQKAALHPNMPNEKELRLDERSR
jgi:Rieske Fe-S protein